MVGNDFDKQLGFLLGKLREERGWSQEQLREIVGVERRETITQWENGTRKVKAEHILLLCKAFDVSADYLLGLSGDPSRTPCAVDDLGLSHDAISSLKSKRSKLFDKLVQAEEFWKFVFILEAYYHLWYDASDSEINDEVLYGFTRWNLIPGALHTQINYLLKLVEVFAVEDLSKDDMEALRKGGIVPKVNRHGNNQAD